MTVCYILTTSEVFDMLNICIPEGYITEESVILYLMYICTYLHMITDMLLEFLKGSRHIFSRNSTNLNNLTLLVLKTGPVSLS